LYKKVKQNKKAEELGEEEIGVVTL